MRQNDEASTNGGSTTQAAAAGDGHAAPQDAEPVIPIMPYSWIVGQEQLKLALEVAAIAPAIRGVLLSGERGTAKSTAVRAFARMMYGPDRLPVTLPINATEDRVVGGWEINELLGGRARWQRGLLEEADGGILYVDEVNLLDDHIVNIILDVASTGVLVIERDSNPRRASVSFTLVGTMNPEEGALRPQLLDRFGLMVEVKAVTGETARKQILRRVLDFDQALPALRRGERVKAIAEAHEEDARTRATLEQARAALPGIEVEPLLSDCVRLAEHFQATGHRSDYVLALAACAAAALDFVRGEGSKQATRAHLRRVAPMVLRHRRPGNLQMTWTAQDDQRLAEELPDG